jgi:hypothetical protein
LGLCGVTDTLMIGGSQAGLFSQFRTDFRGGCGPASDTG